MKNNPKKPNMANNKATVKRLLSYFSIYRFRLVFIILCIITSAVAGVISSLFLQTFIED